MRQSLIPLIGRRVHVLVDRPLGSLHPRDNDILYELNYGYLPDTISGDGAPIDAYIVGVDEPVREATGVVIAVVVREDDIEDKLIVAPDGMSFTETEIAARVHFQERYFRSRMIMDPGNVPVGN